MARPRTPLLDRERIGAAALQLLAEQGEFSVPQIARALGVQTGSLYHHVDGRAGVIELVRERVCAAIDGGTLAAPEPWDRALEAWARSYRAAFAAYPRAIPLLMTTPVRAPAVLAQYERAVALLLRAGFAAEQVMPLLTGLENLVLGSALDLAAPDAMWEPTPGTPLLARALAAQGPGRAEAAFEVGLAAFLAYARDLLGGGTMGAGDASAGG
ncbi:TetR/AcrR family transcriptional regulator C-terminal domain-containing protein [Streptomyces sp. TBY4]|uniref:TetR/AcrR family transcriptional regulator C-terminal domain-containing protein n=1 Tax=Streptomyces sp. TBY4 TaxID=2962030 RepID=UPI0020B8ED01|nr:TetR/AcrR family transcriptional regulator C-terminal domain-containing protein [Streptomyces sp. TBY4]MCP3758048.1 TetR/AcrR family transcriptional regulator C-terminal domain-containing protein [Streptomyces sp. TBY4]